MNYKTALDERELAFIKDSRQRFLKTRYAVFTPLKHTDQWNWRFLRMPCLTWDTLKQVHPDAAHIGQLLLYPQDVIDILVPSSAQLSDDQRALAVSVVLGMNVFVTGSAGTGKSIGLLVAIYTLSHVEKHQVIVSSTTGVSACNINGTTIDSALMLHVDKQEDWEPALLRRDYNKLATLFIDEISMMRPEMLYKASKRLQAVASARPGDRMDSRLPFGGVQVIGCGDFFQLPPVYKKNKDLRLLATEQERWKMFITECGLQDQCSLLERATYVFETPLFWQLFGSCVFLRKVLRQQDQQFVTLLERLRFNLLTEGDVRTLQRTCTVPRNEVPDDLPRLCPKNQAVDEINTMRMEKIRHPEVVFSMIQRQGYTGGKRSTAADGYVGPLDRDGTQHVRLKAGCSVRMTRNFSPTLNDPGYVNGARGILLGFTRVCCVQTVRKVVTNNGGVILYPKEPTAVPQRESAALRAAMAGQTMEVLHGADWMRKIDPQMLQNTGMTPCVCKVHGAIRMQYVRFDTDSTFSEHPYATEPEQSFLEYRQKPDDAPRARNFRYREERDSAQRYYVCVVRIEEGLARGKVAVVPPCIWSAFVFRNYRAHPAVSQLGVPLRLAWAFTIHGSQGLTVERAVVDAPYFEKNSGLLYTAVTRVRSLSGLILMDNTAFHLNQPDSRVYAFYAHCLV